MLAFRIGAAAVVSATILTGTVSAQTPNSGVAVNLGTLSSSPISQPGGGSPISVPGSGNATVNLGASLSTPATSPGADTGGGSTVNLGATPTSSLSQPGAAATLSSPTITTGSTVSTSPSAGTTLSASATGQIGVPVGSTIGLGSTPSATTVAQPTANSTGSAGCAAITQAAANGLTARINADNLTINPPRSVTTMTCLSNFFNGIGLNVITNLLNPQLLLQAVEYQICSAVQSAWNSTIGQIQCGLTLTGFNLGFGGLGGGLICPRISFGGGGAPIASLGFGFGGYPGLYINGSGLPPTGYNLTNVPHGTY